MPRAATQRSPVVLVVLDGWGYRPAREGNAIALANVPTWDRLWSRAQRTLLDASGLAVGLPEGQMGNSEVGHLNLGAGRVVMQDLVRIGEAIRSGEFFRNPVLRAACAAAKARRRHLAPDGTRRRRRRARAPGSPARARRSRDARGACHASPYTPSSTAATRCRRRGSATSSDSAGDRRARRSSRASAAATTAWTATTGGRASNSGIARRSRAPARPPRMRRSSSATRTPAARPTSSSSRR